MFFKLSLLVSFATLLVLPQTQAKTDKIVCFFASWAGYRNGEGSFKPGNINANLCTHVFYAFLGVNSDGSLKILDSWNEIDLHGLENVANLKSVNPNLKVMISIGGWNAGNAILNGIVASTTLRANLIKSCVSFFERWGYDGIDIDWEYPVNSDKANFVKLLQEMREAFNAKGYILSVTVYVSPLSSYDVTEITKVVDLMNIMSYDYHTTVDGFTGHNAPLYGSPSINESVSNWLSAGADKTKLTLSVPFYGHSYSLADENNSDIGATATVGIAGPFTQNPGTLGFNEICAFYNDFATVWDNKAQVPYSHQGTNWISFDNEQSVAFKAQYAKNMGLAGLTIWSIDTDDFHGTCGTAYALLQAIKNNLD